MSIVGNKIRYWWIQKPISNNCPLRLNGAVFETFQPTVTEKGCEWIKAISLDDFHKEVNINITRWVEVCQELQKLKQQNEKLKKALEFYADKSNWLRDVKGWRHDMIVKDLDDETLEHWEGRFSGKRARQTLKEIEGEK